MHQCIIVAADPTPSRRNPGDQELRSLERRFNETGDHQDWFRLQQARMRRGFPYERTFIEHIIRSASGVHSDEVDGGLDNLPSFIESLDSKIAGYPQAILRTNLNNGWFVVTWWDDNQPDFGWSVAVNSPDGVESDILSYKGLMDTDEAIVWHRRVVKEIIDGEVEPFIDSPPMLI